MKRRRELTSDDRTIWAAVTKDVTPYHPRPTAPAPKRPAPLKTESKPLAPRAAAAPKKPPQPARKPVHREHAMEAGDPKFDQRAARGRLPIEATLDMHGMHQTEAHAALRRFVTQARAMQFRCILVITGKGAPSSGRGILRQRFYDWVEEPEIRSHVSRIASAHQRHGGGGAFYIFLKSPDAPKHISR